MLCQLSYRGANTRRDSNPQPPDSKSDALSIAPRVQTRAVERRNIEHVSLFCKTRKKNLGSTPDGIRTRNPQIRSLMRYPLRHGCKIMQYSVNSTTPSMCKKDFARFCNKCRRWRRPAPQIRSGDLRSESRKRSSAKIGTIQRRLAWPLRKDDTHKSRMYHF